MVLVLVALASGVISLALRDGQGRQLEEEGARLIALFEGARAESRAAGMVVRWVPAGPEDAAVLAQSGDGTRPLCFRFTGLPSSVKLPQHWLATGVSAQVMGARHVLLGPDAILPPQRVMLRLADRRLEVSTDGLSPFAVSAPEVEHK